MQAVLWGQEPTQLGEVVIQAVSDDVACGPSRGQRRKAYPYAEPNEDTVAALGPQTTLLVVADGHNRFEAVFVGDPARWLGAQRSTAAVRWPSDLPRRAGGATAARLVCGAAHAWVVVVSDGFSNFVDPQIADRVLSALSGHASRYGGTTASAAPPMDRPSGWTDQVKEKT